MTKRDPQRDARMLEMWMAGKNVTEIAAAFEVSDVRVIHEMNIILNNKAAERKA